MAWRQYWLIDLRCEPQNGRDNEWDKDGGDLLDPPYQRLRGHWERTGHRGGRSGHSPLVNRILSSIYVRSQIYIPTRVFPRYALTNFTDKEAMLNTEDTGSMENLFEIRRYQIDLTNEQVANPSQYASNLISNFSVHQLFCLLGLFVVMGEQRSRGATLLQPVWLPKGQPRLLWKVYNHHTSYLLQMLNAFYSS